jgi:Zn-dependent protease
LDNELASPVLAFIITFAEVIDMLIMTVAAGFIFMDIFKRPSHQDPVEQWTKRESWKNRFLYAVALVAPPLILHELAHKFVAMSQGLTATFHAAYTWLFIGVILKIVSFPFIVIVPAFVRIHGETTPLGFATIAFAGPAVHLLLFGLSWLAVRKARKEEWVRFWHYSKIINGFLFIFNMLPIPGFDGSKVFSGLMQAF